MTWCTADRCAAVSRGAGALALREIADVPRAGRHDHEAMSESTQFTAEQAREIGEAIGIDWATAPFEVEQFRAGMDVELEHGRHDPTTDVTGSDPVLTGKIALAHLNEFPDYYTRLATMEADAEAYWRDR